MSDGAIYPSLRGRTVLVTGGASGIGEAIVRAFAAAGAQVGFVDIQDERGTALAEELGKGGATAVFERCDLLDIAAVRATFALFRERLGPAAALISNAANDQRQSFEEITPESFDTMLGLNLKHVVFTAQAVTPQMRELGYGSIVNMTSGAWVRGGVDMQAYCAAKAAIVGFTNSLARQLGPERIRVNALAPGMVVTERQRQLWYQDESKITQFRTQQCLPDPVEGEDVANMALFLAADESKMITKQMLLVNAGVI
ncbi:SDR family NAD(P)-dependent oxidoreductase [Bosea caraganae]|uniref:SDR family NAD(P)-dependent oxidoreductase n=1 Tax=Bosea caraganae TaxID=2763117 RepID=A0A370L2I9_9HYPH|nr:SDR family NAD(P)-dependent oxidoreductase [Bosea caraganae]RDJ22261.1 SDR family NAD(P)-dependent oxidoreductase [Bosea caraganae]RDJ22652.1 SDR family NAD(P)-dependent oxidoreductase [Bosea caraganae]